MKVLLIKLSAFGDLIHCLPALNDVLARDDVSEVHWLVDTRFSFVTEVFPKEVRIHAVDLKGAHPVRAAWQMMQVLRRERFDVVLDLQTLIKSSLFGLATGAKVYGFDAREVREKPASWLQHSTQFHDDEQHVVQKYRHVAAAPWQTEHPEPLAYAPPTIHQTYPPLHDETLIKMPYVVLSLGGSWATKELPNATWQAIVAGIHAQGLQPVCCWGSQDEHLKAQTIAAEVPLTILPQRLGMQDLCALLSASQALIATDTGVLHLAAALGVPTASFWGASASWRSGPLGAGHHHIESKPACGPCFKRQCANFVCMDMVRADDILLALRAIVEGESLE